MHESTAEDTFIALLERGEAYLDVPTAWATFTKVFRPDSDIRKMLNQLHAIKNQAKETVKNEGNILERLIELNGFFTGSARFKGAESDYSHPRNSFLCDVLETRVGIPISLSVIFIEIGRYLGLKLAPISFPAHFLVKEMTLGIICDPYNGLVDLSHEECFEMLQQIYGEDIDWSDDYLDVAPKQDVLLRMLRNLRQSFDKTPDAKQLQLTDHFIERVATEFKEPKAIATIH